MRSTHPHAPRASSPSLSTFGTVALVLLIGGGLNWALVGLFNLDVVAVLFGATSAATRGVYLLVGVAALYALTLIPRVRRRA